MRKPTAIPGSALFFLLAPGTMAGLIPWWITHWQFRSPFLGLELSRTVVAVSVVAGADALMDSFACFALQGRGTPASIAATQSLVVTGLYRYVRNPMYVAVLAVILGQALLFGDWRLVAYGALFWVGCHLFVMAYEEPTLARTYGTEYAAYCANVRRWIPHFTPW